MGSSAIGCQLSDASCRQFSSATMGPELEVYQNQISRHSGFPIAAATDCGQWISKKRRLPEGAAALKQVQTN